MTSKLKELLPEIDSTWKHHNGNTYEIIAIANLETTRPEKYPITIVYEGENGKIWSRPFDRWHASMKQVAHSEDVD